MNIRTIAISLLIVLLFVACYEFRPQRLVLDRRVHEEFPITKSASLPRPLRPGRSVALRTLATGVRRSNRVGDGSRILRFTDFKTSNGFDVHAHLVAANDAKDSESVQRAGFIDLVLIKGTSTDHNYHLGSDVDLSRYRAISVWSKRFHINFGTAWLSAGRQMSREQSDFK
jgi:hypothetical protein